MRKIQKILLGVFLGGVLLGGIGTGIAFGEYSSITYVGERKIGKEKLSEESFEFAFHPEEGAIKVRPIYMDNRKISPIVEDETVPEGTIRYELTYNAKAVTPSVEFVPSDTGSKRRQDGEGRSEYVQGELSLSLWGQTDEFGLWMGCKDEILNDLKRGQIASYEIEYIKDAVIRVNPGTRSYIINSWQ